MDNLELHKGNNLPSKNELIIQALKDVKVKNAEPAKIGISISDAIDQAIFFLGLNKDTTDVGLLKLTVIQDVKESFPLLTVEEVCIAIKNGSRGKYGQPIGFAPKDAYNWINAYSISNERRENQERLQKEQAEVKEPTEEEKEKLYFDNLINAFEIFKEKGTFSDFGNAVYNYLDKKGKINFTVEQKEDFMRMALANLKNEFNPLQHVGNMIKANEFKLILNEIIEQPKNLRVVSEAKRCALNHLFKEMAEMDMEITDLFDTNN